MDRVWMYDTNKIHPTFLKEAFDQAKAQALRENMRDIFCPCFDYEDQLEFGYEECLKEQAQPGPWRETLMEIRDMWLRLLIYVAGKCQLRFLCGGKEFPSRISERSLSNYE
uniref:Uncharacterized protein n=3 Tax=Oryza TaxID=4527 RepID=Q2R7N7_ORYSJ|nr:hypothetical protein LOC_Os11g15490 [Oryza sativa Japonica Group]ABA92552.1 hypothetical protein LOC_Os11g15490 [Oryza sativa Japonica Group]